MPIFGFCALPVGERGTIERNIPYVLRRRTPENIPYVHGKKWQKDWRTTLSV